MSDADDQVASKLPLQLELEVFRKETNTRAAAIVDNMRAIKLLAAWSSVPVPAWAAPGKPRPIDTRERWLWLWLGLPLRKLYPELAKTADLDPEVIEGTLDMLIRLRLVYPDGTISDSSEQLLMSMLEANTKTRANTARKRK